MDVVCNAKYALVRLDTIRLSFVSCVTNKTSCNDLNDRLETIYSPSLDKFSDTLQTKSPRLEQKILINSDRDQTQRS